MSPGSWSVKGIGSSNLHVYGYGDIDFFVTVNGAQQTATIKKVLYVPGLGTNLISIAAVTNVGLSVHFIETRVTFEKGQAVIMVGERIGESLYHLAIHPRLSAANSIKDSACLAIPSPPSIAVWHQRLAHKSHKTISKMFRNGVVNGLNLRTDDFTTTQLCLGCVSGKMQRSPFPVGRSRAKEVGQLIHSDVCGPMHVATPAGSRFFVLFTDDYSGWRCVYFLKNKSEVADAFKEYMGILRSETGHLIHTLRSDNGGEFISHIFKIWLSSKGIRLETSAPHTPEQNGVSERANRTVVEACRCLLHAKHLSLELWGEAVANAVYTLNRVSNSISPITPFQMWHHDKPEVSHLRIFGTIAYIHIPKAERRKWESKSLKCYFVGYSLTQKAYRFWDPVSRRIKISRDVIFDEQLHDVPDIPSNHEEANPFEVLLRPSREIQSFNNNEERGVMPQAEGESDVNAQPETSHTPPHQMCQHRWLLQL
jgi:hypothetical protein